jgi:hypothetical protein
VLTPFWVFALFTYLAPSRSRRILAAATTCCVVGGGFALAALGIIN